MVWHLLCPGEDLTVDGITVVGVLARVAGGTYRRALGEV